MLVDKYIIGKRAGEWTPSATAGNVFVPGIMELVERTGVHSGDSISVYPTFSVSEKAKETILEYTPPPGAGASASSAFTTSSSSWTAQENVYVIEVNPRSSRTVPFLSKATRLCSLADIATARASSGKSLQGAGHHLPVYPPEKKRWYVKVPGLLRSPSCAGMDAYLSPEMKSTGEAIGYDDSLTRALYKALQASGMSGDELRHHPRLPRRPRQGGGPAAHPPLLQPRLQHRGHQRHRRRS